jgi:hypothetical protein
VPQLVKSHLRELALHVRDVTLILVEGADHFLEYAERGVDADSLTLGLPRHLKIDDRRVASELGGQAGQARGCEEEGGRRKEEGGGRNLALLDLLTARQVDEVKLTPAQGHGSQYQACIR